MDPIEKNNQLESRRDFLKMTAAIPLAVSLSGFRDAIATAAETAVPWYKNTYRWGQINLNELDPEHFDLQWWRGYWKRSETQGMVINAGGIVAFYPSKEPLQHQAQFLNGGDLYGDLTRAAHADGLKVFARMDCGSAFEPFYKAHPDWFAVKLLKLAVTELVSPAPMPTAIPASLPVKLLPRMSALAGWLRSVGGLSMPSV